MTSWREGSPTTEDASSFWCTGLSLQYVDSKARRCSAAVSCRNGPGDRASRVRCRDPTASARGCVSGPFRVRDLHLGDLQGALHLQAQRDPRHQRTTSKRGRRRFGLGLQAFARRAWDQNPHPRRGPPHGHAPDSGAGGGAKLFLQGRHPADRARDRERQGEQRSAARSQRRGAVARDVEPACCARSWPSSLRRR